MDMEIEASGFEAGQRRLNGPQTTGREYRNLSQPTHAMAHDDDLEVPMRDGVTLRADVHRPLEHGHYPVLIAASPYPRQIQNLGAPAGFIEAGATDFFVPRGYVHVIANCRGTGGSGGTFEFFDGQERRDMYDLVEWAAQQPWSDGNVGMIGISYFAGTQMEAAVERPPHLKAIMPIAGTFDLYESATHHGLMSSGFITPFLFMIGMTSGHTNKLWRSKLMDAMRALLLTPGIHKKFAMVNGEAAIAGLKLLLQLHHDPHPWDDLWRAIAAEHPFRDAWWEDRNLLPLLDRVEVPVYLGCDWQNVPLHLPHTFTAYERLTHSRHIQVAMMGEHGLAWPWESLHVEALAWFDHWLKGHDTGILDGPHFRYVIPEAEGWRTSDTWPVPGGGASGLCASSRRKPSRRRRGGRFKNLHESRRRPQPSPSKRDRSAGIPALDNSAAASGPRPRRANRTPVGRRLHGPGHGLYRGLAGRGPRGEYDQRHIGLSSRRVEDSGPGCQQAGSPRASVPRLRSSCRRPENHVPNSAGAECPAFSGGAPAPVAPHFGRPKQGRTGPARIQTRLCGYEFLQYRFFIITIASSAPRGAVVLCCRLPA
jgi:predicted acyl esterase